MQETWVQSLGWEDPLQKDTPAHPSILAWEIPGTEEPGGLQSAVTARTHSGRALVLEAGRRGFAFHLPRLLGLLGVSLFPPQAVGMVTLAAGVQGRAGQRTGSPGLCWFPSLSSFRASQEARKDPEKAPDTGNLASGESVMPAYPSPGLRKAETSLASSVAC